MRRRSISLARMVTPRSCGCWSMRALTKDKKDINDENGHLEIVRLLVEAGADKDKAKTFGATPLYIACEKGRRT